MKKLTLIFLFLFLLGAGIRAIDVRHAVDRPSWRECDVAGIARNYYQEGMNLFYPRVDWRGDGPGFAEMEFPIYPWLVALSYKIFGFHEISGRILSYIISLLTLIVFFQLARYLLPPIGAVVAAIVVTFNPLVINISNSLQPEGLMFLSYVLAGYLFIRWLDNEERPYFIGACAATAFTILAKIPAAHIGIFFTLLIFYKFGWNALRQMRLWLFAIGALLPGALWHLFAHKFWLQYQNSLGLSNEYHWAGLDLFTNPKFVLGIARSELFYVLMPIGILIAVFGAILKWREKAVKYGLFWLAATITYYLITARTTGDQWAAYYHVVSVPGAALLIGSGAEAIHQLKADSRWIRTLALTSTTITILLIAFATTILSGSKSLWVLGLATGLAMAAFVSMTKFTTRTEIAADVFDWKNFGRTLIVYAGTLSICGIILFQSRQIVVDAKGWEPSDLMTCARSFATQIPEQDLVLVTGGVCRDEDGYPVAYNASFMMYWANRKGFNVCIEEQSLESIAIFTQRGARYFIAAKSTFRYKPSLEADLRQTYPVLAECGDYCLFRLTPNPVRD